MKLSKIIISVLIISLSVCICASLGYLTFFLYDQESVFGWFVMPEPPSKIERILQANFTTVYVQSYSGEIYSCKRESRYDIECWNKVYKAPESDSLGCESHLNIPKIPDGVVFLQRIDREYCSRFGNGILSYGLSNEGYIYQYIEDYSSFSLAEKRSNLILIFSLFGGIVGIFFGIMSLRILKKLLKNIRVRKILS